MELRNSFDSLGNIDNVDEKTDSVVTTLHELFRRWIPGKRENKESKLSLELMQRTLHCSCGRAIQVAIDRNRGSNVFDEAFVFF